MCMLCSRFPSPSPCLSSNPFIFKFLFFFFSASSIVSFSHSKIMWNKRNLVMAKARLARLTVIVVMHGLWHGKMLEIEWNHRRWRQRETNKQNKKKIVLIEKQQKWLVIHLLSLMSVRNACIRKFFFSHLLRFYSFSFFIIVKIFVTHCVQYSISVRILWNRKILVSHHKHLEIEFIKRSHEWITQCELNWKTKQWRKIWRIKRIGSLHKYRIITVWHLFIIFSTFFLSFSTFV